jgi:hypothetical protein
MVLILPQDVEEEEEEPVQVDRTEAPYLPPMVVHDEDEDSYYVEAGMTDGTISFTLPKNLLLRKKSGGYAAKHAKAADIMQ